MRIPFRINLGGDAIDGGTTQLICGLGFQPPELDGNKSQETHASVSKTSLKSIH